MISERDAEWWFADEKSSSSFGFFGNIPGCDGYNELTQKLERRGMLDCMLMPWKWMP